MPAILRWAQMASQSQPLYATVLADSHYVYTGTYNRAVPGWHGTAHKLVAV